MIHSVEIGVAVPPVPPGSSLFHSTVANVLIIICLIVSLVFSHLGFWSGNLFLIAPFPDLCLLVPFYNKSQFYPEH